MQLKDEHDMLYSKINKKYEIIKYHEKYRSQVISLQGYLWGGDHNTNVQYFKWKYEDNPFCEVPEGIIALYNDRVIGFRGFFPLGWQVNQKSMKILHLADTVVHPEHRRMGILSIMNTVAIRIYKESEYVAIINLSASKKPTGAYIKQGWIPLVDKKFYYKNRFNFPIQALVVFSFRLLRKFSFDKYFLKTKEGQFGEIEVSKSPSTNEMLEIINNQKDNDYLIRLNKNDFFLKWRYNNIKRNYLFYYLRKNYRLQGYIVVQNYGRYVRIVDYSEREENAIKQILKFLLRSKNIVRYEIWGINISKKFKSNLEDVGFKNYIPRQYIENKVTFIPPILISPVKENYSDSDWIVNSIDIRQSKNWEINEICSDHS